TPCIPLPRRRARYLSWSSASGCAAVRSRKLPRSRLHGPHDPSNRTTCRKRRAMMRKVLVPIGSHANARAQAALEEAIALYREEPVEIHLLNVQVPVSGHVAMFFDIDVL